MDPQHFLDFCIVFYIYIIHILWDQVNAVQALQNNITHTDNLLKKSRKRPNKEKKFKGFKKKNKSKNIQEKK